MEILIQRNIEFLMFLGLHNLKMMFHFGIPEVADYLNLLMFFTIIVTFRSYFHYYSEYNQ